MPLIVLGMAWIDCAHMVGRGRAAEARAKVGSRGLCSRGGLRSPPGSWLCWHGWAIWPPKQADVLALPTVSIT